MKPWLPMLGLCATVTLASLAPGATPASGQDGLLFHASFQRDAKADLAQGDADPLWPRQLKHTTGALPGTGQAIALQRGQSTLVYPMEGNAHTTAGTIAFFWRMDQDIDKAEFTVAQLSCVQNLYFGRWLRLYMTGGRLMVQHFDSHRDASRTRFSVPGFEPRPNQWHHITVTWDQARGVGVYLDGKPARVIDRPWFLQADINHLGLAQTSRATVPGGRYRAERSMSFDEVVVYDRWLGDADIARLAKGHRPTLTTPADPAPLARWRKQVYGWQGSPALPQVVLADDAPGLGLAQPGIEAARDVKRSEYSAFDGELANPWLRAGYREAGKQLEVTLTPDSRFNVVQAFSRGRFDLRTADRPLRAWASNEPQFYHALLDGPVQTDAPLAVRSLEERGLLMSLNLLSADRWSAVRADGDAAWLDLPLASASGDARTWPQAVAMRRMFPPAERTLLLADRATPASGAAGQDEVVLPAMQAVHLLGPAHEQRVGLTAWSLDLQLVGADRPRVLRVEVLDPINPIRRAFLADVAVGKSDGQTGRLRLAVDLRDLVLQPGVRPWVVLTFSEPTRLRASQSQAGFRFAPVQDALPQFAHDQSALARATLSSISEARPWGWDPKLVRRLGYLRDILAELLVLTPDDLELQGHWQWINPQDPKPRPALSAAPAGTPAWAHHLAESLPLLTQAAHWWIDHRMTADGEFGANDGINDDTDLIQDWLNLDLMAGPDEKIRDAIRRVADNSWANAMQDGLGRTTDILHHYEWGLNAQTLLALMDYGCPVAIERLMATARRMDDLTVATDQGRLFISQRFGYSQIRTAGPDGWDDWSNALTLQPSMILAWYNGHPQATATLHQWVRAMAHHTRALAAQQRGRLQGVSVHVANGQARLGGSTHGFASAVWGAYDLTGDEDLLAFLGELIELDLKLSDRPTQTARVLARYLNASANLPAHQARRDALARQVATWLPDATLWQRSLHNSNYMPLDWFHHAFALTGHTAPLDEGLALTRSDITWSLPLLTSAEHSTDRVWLPQRLANRVMLGDLAILRNELYPGHAVSWQHATGRLAALVTRQHRDALAVVVHNLEDHPIEATMHVWRLDHGRYTLTRATDAATTQTQEVTLQRGDSLPVSIPAGGRLTLTLTQLEKLEDIRLRPDAAITHRDAQFDAATGRLTLRVHNIGSASTGPMHLRVMQGDAMLLERTLDALDAPLDLQPRVAEVALRLTDTTTPVTAQLTLADDRPEITQVNNRMTWTRP